MKILSGIILSILFSSCYNADSKTNELNQRITRLEQKVDSLINVQNLDAGRSENISAVNDYFRCKAITKKGTQCKRKSKGGGYCWQHNQ